MHTPLDDFMWFDVATVKFPYSFELVVCDGPALYGHSEPYQSAWRVGLVSVLRDHGVRADEILLDDAEDPRPGSLRARWDRQHDFGTQIAQTAPGAISLHARLGSMVTSTAERIGHREGVSDTLDRRYTSPNFTAWLTATFTAAGSSDAPAAAFVIVESSASASSPISNAPLTTFPVSSTGRPGRGAANCSSQTCGPTNGVRWF